MWLPKRRRSSSPFVVLEEEGRDLGQGRFLSHLMRRRKRKTMRTMRTRRRSSAVRGEMRMV